MILFQDDLADSFCIQRFELEARLLGMRYDYNFGFTEAASVLISQFFSGNNMVCFSSHKLTISEVPSFSA